jgi:hypothetical protein
MSLKRPTLKPENSRRSKIEGKGGMPFLIFYDLSWEPRETLLEVRQSQ